MEVRRCLPVGDPRARPIEEADGDTEGFVRYTGSQDLAIGQYALYRVRYILDGDPPGGRWYGFCPRTLHFGEVAAFLRYNFFSRIIAVLASLIIGIPMANYSDDIGSH